MNIYRDRVTASKYFCIIIISVLNIKKVQNLLFLQISQRDAEDMCQGIISENNTIMSATSKKYSVAVLHSLI